MLRNTTTATILDELVIAPRMGQTQEQEQNTANNEVPSSPTHDSVGKRKSDSLTPPPAPKKPKLLQRPLRRIPFALKFCKDSAEETVGMKSKESIGNTFTPESSVFFHNFLAQQAQTEQLNLLQEKKVKANLSGDSKRDNAPQKVEPAKVNTKGKNQKGNSETHKTLRRL